MRPRFSLRRLLAATTLVAIACYWLFVQPAVNAQRFVDAVKVKNFRRAELLCGDADDNFLTGYLQSSREYDVEVTLHPRRWSDIWKFRQRVFLQIMPLESRDDSTVLVGIRADIVATSLGLQLPTMYPVTFKR